MNEDAVIVANLLERIDHLSRNEEKLGDLYPAQWAVLRYLSRANRFSRSPMALTRYFGTTRGTTSQTVIALERKGYVLRQPGPRDKRSVDIKMTKAGKQKLAADPLLRFAAEIEHALGADLQATRAQLERILVQLINTNDRRSFGICRSCRHFREGGGDTERTPHLCALLQVGLSEADSEQICVEQQVA